MSRGKVVGGVITPKKQATKLTEQCKATSLLIKAIDAQDEEGIERAIFRYGANPNTEGKEGVLASMCLDPRRLPHLVLRGLDINARNVFGTTLLHDYSHRGCAWSVRLLLEIPGLDIDARDNQGRSALSYAKSPGVFKALKAAGADIQITDRGGNNILHYWSQNERVLRFLVRQGVYPIKNHDGCLPGNSWVQFRSLLQLMAKGLQQQGAKPCMSLAAA